MSEPLILDPSQLPDISNLVLEDDTPLDSFINEKQQRLLTTVLYSGGDTGITVPFIAAANVMNITGAEDWWERQVRSYLFWEFGKPPEIAIEIVSPTPGNELGSNLIDYARMRIPYYVVYDPLRELRGSTLRVFELQNQSYGPKTDAWFPEVGLGLTLWEGEFEKVTGTWLRWCYPSGAPIPTGGELAAQKNAQLSQKDAQLSQKDAQLSQKDAELSQKDAQLLEEQARTKRAFIQMIELGLKLKFGEEGLVLLDEISAISDVGVLQAIASDTIAANNLDEIRQIYQS
ncbi:MAG: Uma2 family endonuclease [Oscillatoriales cyanobacterium]|nr:MAG: Uma2 family endonuclease [Oscillatoriales cyanobacterium]